MWRFFQYAVAGRGHEKRDIPCQDKTFILERDGVKVIALADGAGSARLSHYGAACVSEFICQEMADKFAEYYNQPNGAVVKTHIISVLCNALQKLAEKEKCTIDDLASTLLFVAVKNEQYIIGHIGDGVIGYIKNNELKVATKPANGEFANTTYFVTTGNAAESFQLIKGKLNNGINGFVLFSDGTETSFYDKREEKLVSALKSIMNLVRIVQPHKIDFLIRDFFDNNVRKATLDDCSIVIMVNDYDKPFGEYDIRLKAEMLLFSVFQRNINKKVETYQKILSLLCQPRTLWEFSKIIFLKPKIAQKRLARLRQANLIELKNGQYQSILINHEEDKDEGSC